MCVSCVNECDDDEEDDDDSGGGGAYLLAADVKKTPDVSPATDLNCPGTTDRIRAQSPVPSPALIHVHHQCLQGASKHSSFGATPDTSVKEEAKGKSNQWLLVSHTTQVMLLHQNHQR